mgnify:CR=1 FL=1
MFQSRTNKGGLKMLEKEYCEKYIETLKGKWKLAHENVVELE